MNQASINPLSPDVLIEQLVAIEDKRYRWLDEQVPLPSRERDELDNLLDRYIEALLALIRESQRSLQFSNQLPYVIMNSKVEVELLNRQQRQFYRILPFYEDRVSAGDISILSPVGRSLLLQESGARVSVPAPGGELLLHIHSISMHHGG
ncbi:MAG: GreA/GreB family elongation factor [Syntrophomonadaceae bacterium]